jgi:hypothetical protein
MKEEQKSEEAKRFIERELRDGPRKADDLFKRARDEEISGKTLMAAAEELHVHKYRDHLGSSSKWEWSLPEAWEREIFESFDAIGSQLKQPPIAEDVHTIDDLLKLSGIEFESAVAALLAAMRFRVQLTQTTGDGGIDIVATSEHPISGGRYLIQCKRFAVDVLVGSPHVRDLFGALSADQKAAKAILITTSGFTPAARKFAEHLPVELIDGIGLVRLLAEFGGQARE